MDSKNFKPYVPADTVMKEFTFKAVFLGVIMAVILGAANAYLGMKAGLTVSATFPAAVVAMATLRLFKGTILEENIARTTASVGEALVAGAIFTIPAFVISGVWDNLKYLESTIIMFIGGLLGVLFVIVLRRSLVVEADLPFPESVAAAEIVKAGQGGKTGAVYVFSSMGLAAVWEFFKNSNGIQLVKGFARGFFHLPDFKLSLFGKTYNFSGGFLVESPAVYPALVGVGFIVGLRVSAVLFSGSLGGWIILIPVFFLLNSSGANISTTGGDWVNSSMEIWRNQVRPLAVGTMIVAAFFTLYNLRVSLTTGIKKAFSDIAAAKSGAQNVNRLELDLDFKKILLGIAVLAIPLFLLYNYFSGSFAGSILLTIVMLILGFLFSAVAGYLVGLVGGSNNPISGLTLSSLLIAALLLVAIGITGDHGVMAVLGVAGIVCCAAGIAGDMIQDLKVGHILGGTPWRMQLGEIIGVTFSSLVLIGAMMLLNSAYHIGSEELPAPQAGLMALMAKGIVGGEMAWSLVISGMILGVLLIIFRAPYPMLIAVGMYLPFNSTFAIFVGGLMKWGLTKVFEKRNSSESFRMKAENVGVLISSGLIAGEALMAIVLGFVFMGLSYYESTFSLANLAPFEPNLYIGMLIFAGLGYLLIKVPLDKAKE